MLVQTAAGELAVAKNRTTIANNRLHIMTQELLFKSAHDALVFAFNYSGQQSRRVTVNWRITFEFVDGDVYIVNYEDYH